MKTFMFALVVLTIAGASLNAQTPDRAENAATE